MTNYKDKAEKHREDHVFFSRIQYRCNSSWQGTIQWMDGRKSEVFRSVLELTNLLKEAMSKTGDSFPADKMHSWLDKESVS